MTIIAKVKSKPEKAQGSKAPVLRQCALSREKRPIDELLRFVLSPEHNVTPDLRCKLPGRGLWLSADRKSVTDAVKKKLFARGFKKKALASDDLVDMIEKLTRSDALHCLSLANKAGLVLTGYEKIKRALDKGEIQWLLHAFEASRGGSDKLDRYFIHFRDGAEPKEGRNRAPGTLEYLFTGDELSLALGGLNVIHIGLKQGEMARRFALALKKATAFAKESRAGAPEDAKRT